MKNPPFISLPLALTAALSWTAAIQAESAAPAGSAQIQSIFVLPVSSKDGRDPFFPDSTRMVQVATTVSPTAQLSALKVPGIFGTPDHLLAIINNHTFSSGDEGDVKTPAGMVHIRCLEIQADHVVVEMNGQTHRINMEAE